MQCKEGIIEEDIVKNMIDIDRCGQFMKLKLNGSNELHNEVVTKNMVLKLGPGEHFCPPPHSCSNKKMHVVVYRKR